MAVQLVDFVRALRIVEVPTGEPETWDWDGNLLKPPFQPDTTAVDGR